MLDFYWRDVTDKRAQRRAKRAKSEVLTLQDYVLSFPPEYKGPKLPPEIAKAWADFQRRAPFRSSRRDRSRRSPRRWRAPS